jgi:hypothetical protein
LGRICPPIDDVDVASLDPTKLGATRLKRPDATPCFLLTRRSRPDTPMVGLQLRQNVACGFTALRFSAVGSQHCKGKIARARDLSRYRRPISAAFARACR